MAYTYDNFTQAATKAGLLDGFSEDDLKIAQVSPEYGLSMLKLRQDAAGATTAEQKLLAQEAENQLRTSYGGVLKTDSGYTYGKETEYQKLLDDVSNYQKFEYNPTTDPRYGAYKKAYLREADRAREDTLAKASAASGGMPNSFAVNAAAQAGNYYTGKLNDVIPTLYNDALNQHLAEYGEKGEALGVLTDDRNFDYNKYLAELEQKQQEWNNAAALFQMGIDTPEIRELLGMPAANPSTGSAKKKTTGSGLQKMEEPGSLLDQTIKLTGSTLSGGGVATQSRR